MKTIEVMIDILDKATENDSIRAIVPTLLATLGEWIDAKETQPPLKPESTIMWVEDEKADYKEMPWDVWMSDCVIVKTSKGIIEQCHWEKWVKQENGETDFLWEEERRDDPIITWWTPFEDSIKEEEDDD